MPIVFAGLIVFLLLASCELWWRKQNVHDELSRKFVHITVGSFVAFWPFFLSWDQIRLLSLAFVIVVLLSKRFKLFQAIHSVQRLTYGELFFALAVGGATLITQDRYIYLAALLMMSLADGLAAVVGVRYGGKQPYTVFGHNKSLIGSATFYVVSVAILLAVTQTGMIALAPLELAGLALAATVIENIGVFGLDNLLVPMLVAGGLTLLT
ncbi:MAG: hypothetical protein ABIV43_02950 [Candidatus Saccharimonadales bacterium]